MLSCEAGRTNRRTVGPYERTAYERNLDATRNRRVRKDCVGVRRFGTGWFGAGRRHRPGGAALRPVRLMPWGRPRRWARRPIQLPRPPELGLEHLPHLLHGQLGSGQCLSDHLGWRESTAGQPGSRRAVLSPGHQGLRPLALARLADRFWTRVEARSAPETRLTQGICY